MDTGTSKVSGGGWRWLPTEPIWSAWTNCGLWNRSVQHRFVKKVCWEGLWVCCNGRSLTSMQNLEQKKKYSKNNRWNSEREKLQYMAYRLGKHNSEKMTYPRIISYFNWLLKYFNSCKASYSGKSNQKERNKAMYAIKNLSSYLYHVICLLYIRASE